MKSGVIAVATVLILSAFVMGIDTMGVTDPHLDGDKAISPGLIYAEGRGSPDEAGISLTILGDGDPFVTTFPQDVVFAIDSSGSMIWSDPSDKRKTATKHYVDQLDPSINERAAVVDFDDEAYLMPKSGGDHLSTDYGKIKGNIDMIDSIGGTDIPGAMSIANSELINYGLQANIWIVILLTDGQNYCYEPPYWGTPCPRLDALMDDENDPLVKQAIDNGIIYYTVGLGDDVNAMLLQNLAELTGGTYHSAATADELQAIYDSIHQDIVNTAAKSVTVTQTLKPEFEYVPGSFSVEPTSLVGNVAIWEIPSLSIGEYWGVTFDVTSDTCGYQMEVDEVTTVTYIAFDGASETLTLPAVIIDVVGCNDAPVADCGGPYSGNEGSPIPLDASGSYDPDSSTGDYIVLYEWDLDDDGQYDDAVGETTSNTWGDNGVFPVGLQVMDLFGLTSTAECSVEVYNVEPDVKVNTPFVYTLTQGSNGWSIPAVETATSASDFYDYHSASAHTGFEKPYHSFLYLHRDITDPNNKVGLFIVHDIDGDVFYPGSGYNSGSPDAESWMDLSGIPSGAYLAQSDDPGPGPMGGEFKYFPATGTAEGRWHWWYNTDGGAIGGLSATAPWCITIDPLMWKDVNSWAYYYTGGSHIDLDMNEPLTICYTPPTEPDEIEIDEGGTVSLSGYFDDPGWEDTHSAIWDFDDGLTETAAFSPGVGYTHHNVDPVTHTYGDDGTYSACLIVTDDDGDVGTDCVDIVVNNVDPVADPFGPYTVDEGSLVLVGTMGYEQGSDDLTFVWEFEDGPTVTHDSYNDGSAAEPDYDPLSNNVRTSDGTYPFTAGSNVTHTYCDNGLYDITLTLGDDDDGSSTYSSTVEVVNVAPTVNGGWSVSGTESTTLAFSGTFSDPGCDTWTWWWDFRPTLDSDGDGDPTNDVDVLGGDSTVTGALPPVQYTFNDDFKGNVYLWVQDDDGGAGFGAVPVDIANIAPEVSEITVWTLVDVTLRVAGEKWHDVVMTLYDEDGYEIGSAGVTRYPGSPNDQMVTIQGVMFDLTKGYTAQVIYTPEDDPVNGQPKGANPAWIILDYEDGCCEEVRLKHTFNVNHEDWYIWDVDLSPYVAMTGQTIHFKASAEDQGSDDLTFVWNFEDGSAEVENTHLNNHWVADPYPSYWYGIAPFGAEDDVTHEFALAGTYTVMLTVRDDDDGMTLVSVTIEIFESDC